MNDDIRQTLVENDFFRDLPASVVDFLAGHADTHEVAEGRTLFRYDDRAEKFFLLLSGRVSIEIAAIEGPPLDMQHLGPGEVLGWSWLIPPYRWSFQARVEEPVEVVEFDGAAILEQCEADPAFGYVLLKRFSSLMSERLEFARLKMIDEWNPPGYA